MMKKIILIALSLIIVVSLGCIKKTEVETTPSSTLFSDAVYQPIPNMAIPYRSDFI